MSDDFEPGTGEWGTYPSAPALSARDWAGLGRNPLGYQGQLRASGSAVIAPGLSETVVRWTGEPMSPCPVSLAAAPDPTIQGNGQSFDPALALDNRISARLRWTVGVAQFSAELDLVRATIGLTIPAATAASLEIVNETPADTVKFAAVAARIEGAAVAPPATRTRIASVPAVGTTTIEIPQWAREVTPMWLAAGPVPITFADPKTGAFTGGVSQIANGFIGLRYPIPGGASQLIVGPAPVAQADVPFVFHLTLP